MIYLIIINFLWLVALTASRFLSKKILEATKFPIPVIWLERFIIVMFTLALLFFYLTFFVRTAYACEASTNVMIKHVNSMQTQNWDTLSNSLQAAADNELIRRRQLGITSNVVTLRDIGVTFNYQDGSNFRAYPGLASLYAIRPQWFTGSSLTNVTQLISEIRSDPFL